MTLLLQSAGVFNAPDSLTITLVVLTVVLLVAPAIYVTWSAKREREQTKDALEGFRKAANDNFAQLNDQAMHTAQMMQMTLYVALDITPEEAAAKIQQWGKELVEESKKRTAEKRERKRQLREAQEND